MNTERTSSSAPRLFARPNFAAAPRFLAARMPSHLLRKARVFFTWLAAALVLVGLAATASQAGLKPISSRGTGVVLALAAQLRAARLQAAAAAGHTSDGRTLLPKRMMRSGAILKSRATAASVVPISGGVQTYDVFNPTPAFRPLIGYGSLGAINNSSTNPPVYISALTPTNLSPVWSADETFVVFSSNRNATGGLNTDADNGGSRFHLWAISVNGGEAFQITTSTGPAGGGELFPALSRNNLTLAFTSDAATPNIQNLYALSFSYSALSTSAAGVTSLSPTAAIPVPPAPLTLRAANEATSQSLTGFSQVFRPTFSPNDDQLIVFSAYSVTGTYSGHEHLYFLYTSSGGFSQGNNVSYPGKLTDGPANDTDPAYAPDGSYIAFASTANTAGFTRNPNNAFGPTTPSDPQDPDASQSLSSGMAATRSLFLISGGLSSTGVPFGTVPTSPARINLSATGGRVTQGSAAGLDDYGPAWSSFANQNQYTNPSGNLAYLAFARSAPAADTNHDIYYFQVATGVSQPSSETLVPETTVGNGNVAVQLNTDDSANAYDDTYPTWSPFLSIFSIAYMSNRTVTYNNPASGFPVEVAVSVPHGGMVVNAQDATADYTVGTGYEGVLISQVLNLDPPTLLRFSSDEVVHVQAGSNPEPVTGTPNKLAATGGQAVTLTVRLSDREAGIADTGGPDGGPRVYVQIKDPDGKYQDAQNTEHKVFVKDTRYDTATQANRPLSDNTSGTADSSLGGNAFINYGDTDDVDFRRTTYPSYGPVVNNVQVGYVQPRGAHGGSYPAGGNDPGGPPGTYIFVGRDTGGTNPNKVDYGLGAGPQTIPNGDPRLFIPWGPEYECQVVNPQFVNGDTTPDNPAVTVKTPAGIIGDYISPYWLAGVDDQGAFSGGTFDATAFTTGSSLGRTGTDRPVVDYTTTNTPTGGGATTTTTHPAEWLPLTKVPASEQDNNGGVLYTVTWTTPGTGSDFYVDVIAYDNAVFPNFPAATSNYTGQKTNWRIYDNVGGFSTNQSIGGNDILLVSDYALGQKFAATTFGGRNLNLNLVPKLFGTESYLTDVDVSILPNTVYAGIPTTISSYQFNPALRGFIGNFFANPDDATTNIELQNGLGVGSYYDNIIDDQTRVTVSAGTVVPNVQSQRYSIWRILSRGPVPASLLQSYTPTPVAQPAIADAPNLSLPAASVLDAPRCVIWLSPYTGDVLADPGTLDDPGDVGSNATNPRSSTTSTLTNFVKNGGRLFITGQDVGSTLTQGGTVNNAPSTIAGSPNFLPDVLNAMLTSNAGGLNVLTATNNRVTGAPTYDGIYQGRSYTNGSTFAKPDDSITVTFPNLPFQDNLVLGDADYNDGSYSQIPAQTIAGGASVQGQIDTISALNGATTAMTYPGGGAMVYHDDPYLGGTNGLGTGASKGNLPNGGTGSRVVYAAFGLEGLSNDYQTIQDPDPSMDNSNNTIAFDQRIPPVSPRNPRPMIIHNIVSFLRTGYVSGTITQTAGTGQGGGLGIDGVTVYLKPASGVPPSTRAAFSALTANGGRFTIAGIEPGTYTLVAIKPGFQRAVSNNNVSFTVEGDTTETGASLTLTPEQPGNIAGVVHDTTGAQISGATVTFTSQDGSVTKTMLTVNGSVPSNPAENYFIQNVPVTTYTGTATGPLNNQNLPEYIAAAAPDPPTPPATAPNYSQGVPVLPNTTTQPVNFTLTANPASISGLVIDAATNAPIVGATVTLTGPNGTVLATQKSDATGAYSFTGIAAGTALANYTVAAVAGGYGGNQVIQQLQAGNVYTGINIPLTAIASGTIKGVVTDARTGLPLANATVTFTMTGGTPMTTTTASNGTYALPSLPVGTYSGTAAGPATGQAYQPSAAQTVLVTTIGTTPPSVNFALVPILATITGTVTDAATGQPLSGVTITVTDANKNAVATNPAIVTTDASGNYTATVTPGTYFVTASKASYITQSSASTAFALSATVNVSFKLVNGIGTIGGLVTNQSGSGLISGATVTFIATGQTTGTTFTTSGTASAAPDGSGSINYSGQLAAGTYTVTVSQGSRTSAAQTITIKGGVFNRLDFTGTNGLPALHTFPAGIQLVSVPYDYSALGFSGLFGALNTAATGSTPNGNRSHVAVWNPLTDAYALDPNPPADALRLGVGYWVYLKNPVPVTQQGATPTGDYVAVSLGQGWNQIGVPNPSSAGVAITSLMFDNGAGGMISFTQASSSQYNLVTRPLYQYVSGSSYLALSTTSGVLTPWNGYWIYVNAAATLEIPTH